MFRAIVATSLQFRLLVLIAAAGVMFLGIAHVRSLPVDILPEFSPTLIEVQTEALGLSTEEVESLITVPLEADLLAGVSWLRNISSKSVNGLSSILLEFEPDTDLIEARQMVQERLTQAFALPNVSRPPVMLQPNSSASRVMMIGLTSESLSLIDMSVLARWNIVPRLAGVAGVANVSVWGQRQRQLQVQVDPKTLQASNMSLLQVISTVGNALWVSPLSFLNASTPGTGGFIDTPNQRLGIKHFLPISTAESLAQVPVEGTLVPLSSVTTVVEDHQPLIGDAVINGGTGLLIVVDKLPWGSTAEVTRLLEAEIDAMRPGLTGIDVNTDLFRPATYIEQSIDNLVVTLTAGLLILAAVLLIFSPSWRLWLISMIAISLSFVVAVLALALQGVAFNLIVLSGLLVALVAVVDDAVVYVRTIARRLQENQLRENRKSFAQIVLEATGEARYPLLFTVLIMLVLVAPLFIVPGRAGVFLQPIAISYGLAVLASFAVALIVTPALSLVLLPGSAATTPGRSLSDLLERAYAGLLARTVRWWVPSVAIASLLIVAGLAALPQLRPETIIPTFRETDLLVRWSGDAGTSHTAMRRLATHMTNELGTLAGVTNVSAHIGRAIFADEVVSINSGEIWVSIDPERDREALIRSVEEVVSGYPGISHHVTTYLEERTRAVFPEVKNTVTVRIYGPELDVLHATAAGVSEHLAGTPGVVRARLIETDIEPHVQVRVRLEDAVRLGLKPGDVRRAAAVLLHGIDVGALFEHQKVFDVVVLGVADIRNSLTDIQELLIDLPNGSRVRLEDVADVSMVPTPNVIQRESVSRYVDIELAVQGRSAEDVANQVEDLLLNLSFPLEYHPEVFTEFAEVQSEVDLVLLTSAVAAALIFLLLQAALGSWRLALLAYFSLLAIVGGGVAVAAVTGGVSLGSLLGLVAISGVAVRAAVPMIKQIQRLHLDVGGPPAVELVVRGATARLLPILTTALATGLALLPLLVVGDSAGHEIVRPMAIVMIGGLVCAVLVNLLVVPALYLKLGGRRADELDFGATATLEEAASPTR